VNGKTVAEAVKNIKKAGMVMRVSLMRADIFDNPEFETGESGTFGVITSDLPFGMQVSKGEDLDMLYEQFVAYCENILSPDGKLVTITSEHELLRQKLSTSQLKITQTLELKVPTSVGAYLYPRIFVCEWK
jgi:23S rRNA G2445 N2-methylase RlmL